MQHFSDIIDNQHLNLKDAINSNLSGAQYEELNAWFDRLWDEAVPFEEVLVNSLEESWALKTVNPYDIFILTLYHLTKVTIDRRTSQIWFWDNPDFGVLCVLPLLRSVGKFV